jgi:hypothetical protein
LVASGREEHLLVALDAYQKIISGPVVANVKASPTQKAMSVLIVETLTSHEHELQRVRSHAAIHNRFAFDNALQTLNAQREKHLSMVISPINTLDDALGETDSPEPANSIVHEPATHGVMLHSLPYPMDEELLAFYPGGLPAALPGLDGSFPPVWWATLVWTALLRPVWWTTLVWTAPLHQGRWTILVWTVPIRQGRWTTLAWMASLRQDRIILAGVTPIRQGRTTLVAEILTRPANLDF